MPLRLATHAILLYLSLSDDSAGELTPISPPSLVPSVMAGLLRQVDVRGPAFLCGHDSLLLGLPPIALPTVRREGGPEDQGDQATAHEVRQTGGRRALSCDQWLHSLFLILMRAAARTG